MARWREIDPELVELEGFPVERGSEEILWRSLRDPELRDGVTLERGVELYRERDELWWWEYSLLHSGRWLDAEASAWWHLAPDDWIVAPCLS